MYEITDQSGRILIVDELTDYPSIEPLLYRLTPTELDMFMTFMENGMNLDNCPDIIKADLASLHRDAIHPFAVMVGEQNV